MRINFVHTFIQKNNPTFTEEEQRNVFVLYFMNVLVAVFTIPWLFLFHAENAPSLVYLNVFYLLFLFLILFGNMFFKLPFKVYRTLLILIIMIIMITPNIILGKSSYSIMTLMLLPMGMILVFSTKEKRTYQRYLVGNLIVYFSTMYVMYSYPPLLQLSEGSMEDLNKGDLVNTFIAAVVVSYLYYAKNSEIQTNLVNERKKSDSLILNILPSPIAKKLKGNKDSIVDSFEKVTIVFIDIVGFTAFADTMPPRELVNMLDEMFTSFDVIADKYDIEKIKTIGDAYMAVCGLPTASDQHCQNVANFALEVDSMIKEKFWNKYKLQVRIGIHTGKAIAGVIGRKKFSYDLWGMTVNKASRFEAYGTAGKIHITKEVKEILKENYEIESNGKIMVKGIGEMDSYFLLNRKPSVQPN